MTKLLLLYAFVGATAAAEIDCAQFAKSVAKGPPAQRLKQFYDLQWKYNMTEYPEAATANGYPGQNDRWTDESLTAVRRRFDLQRCQLDSLHKIARTKLSASDRLNFDLLERDLKLGIESQKFGAEFMPIDHMNGVQSQVPCRPCRYACEFRARLSRHACAPG